MTLPCSPSSAEDEEEVEQGRLPHTRTPPVGTTPPTNKSGKGGGKGTGKDGDGKSRSRSGSPSQGAGDGNYVKGKGGKGGEGKDGKGTKGKGRRQYGNAWDYWYGDEGLGGILLAEYGWYLDHY